MMTEYDPAEDDIAAAAQKLQESFEEMSDLTTQLSGDMSEVADGFQSFGKKTESPRANQSTGVNATTSRTGYGAADD